MNVNAGGDMFSEDRCLSDSRLVAKHLQKIYMSEDEIRDILGNTRTSLLLNVDCLPAVDLLAERLLNLGLSEHETKKLIGGRLSYELNRMLNNLFK
jgi:hypothetical protein